MVPALKVKNVVKTYGKVTAVDRISFTVGPREIFALIGPNGAGKSTTLRIVATVLRPTSGAVSVYGHDVIHESETVRTLMTYLPEEAGAYKNMSGLGYLKFAAALYSTDAKQQREYVSFAREIAGLRGRINDRLSTYSKGMTRKILLARTVMSRPKLAILDEPTSGLDVINALAIRTMIRNLSKEGMAVLLSSHNMLEIAFLSDRVGIIEKGKLIEVGVPSELMRRHHAANLEEVFATLTRAETKPNRSAGRAHSLKQRKS